MLFERKRVLKWKHIEEITRRKLKELDKATSLEELGRVPSNHDRKGQQSLTPKIIYRLAIYFKLSYDFWLGIQQDYERECLEDILASQEKQIKKEVQPLVIPKQSTIRLKKHL